METPVPFTSVTCNVNAGEAWLMPTSPFASTCMRSTLFVRKLSGCASVLPIKLDDVNPEFPVVSQTPLAEVMVEGMLVLTVSVPEGLKAVELITHVGPVGPV